jgi:5-methyltetrahydrofolate--homocysteine methyltransferase
MSQELHAAILDGDLKRAVAETEKAVAKKTNPLELVQNYMITAMNEVGRRFQCEEFFVPEMLLSARAMKACLAIVRPLLTTSGEQPAGRVVIGTIKGDLHDIGKNLVASMLEGGGFEVLDLGTDVTAERFVAAVNETSPDLLCLSALLTVTMPAMKTTIEALEQAGIRQRVKILVGGAPITQHFADQIGADGYGENAVVAVSLVRKLMQCLK